MPKLTMKAARVNVGLTQEELSKIVGVSKKTIWSWENGLTFPDPEQIDLLCGVFGVTYDNIIFLKQNNA